MRDLSVGSYWIDTLVLKKMREILTLLCCIIPSSSGKPTEAQDVAYPLAKLMVRYTIGLVHSIAYFIKPMTEA